MLITTSALSLYILQKRKAILREICSNAVQLFELEKRGVEQLCAAIKDNEPQKQSVDQVIKQLGDVEANLTQLVKSALANEDKLITLLPDLSVSEIKAERVRKHYQGQLSSFEKRPSSDKMMSEMQAKAEEIAQWLETEADTSQFDALIAEFEQNSHIGALKEKQSNDKPFGVSDRLIAKWSKFSDYQSVVDARASFLSKHADIVAARKERLIEVNALMEARAIAYRNQSRLRIANELNSTLQDVEVFDQQDDARQISISALLAATNVFETAHLHRAAKDLNLNVATSQTAKAVLDQVETLCSGARQAAVGYRSQYKLVTELVRHLRQHMAYEYNYRFTETSEIDSWIEGINWNAEDVFENIVDRVPEVEEKLARLRAS